MKIKKIFKNVRVLILLVFLVLAVVAIYPNPGAEGVAIRNVAVNSSAADAGIESPSPNAPPMSRERIIAINNQPVEDLADYYESVDQLRSNLSVTIQTSDGVYNLQTREAFETITLNETETRVVQETYQETVNGTLVNKTRNETIIVNKTERRSLGMQPLGLSVYEAPTSNIRKGLDLEGGTRVVLSPQEQLDEETLDLLISNLKRRLNIYGLSDVVVRKAGDIFSDQQYIVVEIAGANEEEVKDLISSQGKFEAKIGREVVFQGGTGDITYVCRSSDCSGIDPQQGCSQAGDQYMCRYRFSIALRPEAAERQADITRNLTAITTDEEGNLLSRENQYLNETLDLYLDGRNVDSLNIGADLKGRAVTDIQISGSGVGDTEQQAAFNALEDMKQMQTVLITGSLPVELNVEKTENLSPQLGEEFIRSAFLMGLLAMFAVSFIVYLRYRRAVVFVPMIITMVSEVVLILGMASLIGWNIDLAAIAGIIIAVGTGVDDQIVITDEVLRGAKTKYLNWRTKIKNAFFIIMAAFFTTFVAMIPLVFAGAGILKGFAITTMLGISFGVFITRPAFAAMMEHLLNE
ncbi:MAG: hypothetical protein ACQESG_05945 [Nanobdellota archaeon]